MSNAKLEAHEAKHRRLAMELFDKVGNLELSTDIAISADMFLDLTKLLKKLQWHLWEAGFERRLLDMQKEVRGKYDTPAYFATIHLTQTNDPENDVSAEELARVLVEECTRYVKPKNGWPEQGDPRSQSLKREIDVEYVAAMQVHWLRMGRELLGDHEPPAELLACLSKLEGQLLTHLWKHPNSRIRSLHKTVWMGRIVGDEAIIKAAERLNNKLVNIPDYSHIEVRHSGEYIVMDK